MQSLVPFLMFCREQAGQAGPAIELYTSVFDDARTISIDRHPDGTVLHAELDLGGHRLKLIDSAAPHEFTFTPAISLWVDCSSSAELERIAHALADGGQFLMGIDNYGFSKLFCWVADRFGVTWQLNLPA